MPAASFASSSPSLPSSPTSSTNTNTTTVPNGGVPRAFAAATNALSSAQVKTRSSFMSPVLNSATATTSAGSGSNNEVHQYLHPHKPAAPKSRSQSIESVIKQEVDWITLLDELKDKREQCNSRIDAILREMMQRRAGYRNDTSSTALISHEPVYNLQLELDRLEKRSIELTSMIRSAKKRHVASMPAAPIVKAKTLLKTGKRARQRQAREFLKDFYAHNPDGSLLCQWYSQTSR